MEHDDKPVRERRAQPVPVTEERQVHDDGSGDLPVVSVDKSARFAEVVNRLASGYKTASQLAYEVLKEAIVSGALAPGEWLRQEWIASAIGVSRIPVRSALIQIESEGLIELHPHRGARVRALSSSQIDEIFRLRAQLEAYALQRSISQISPQRVGELQMLARELDEQPEGSRFLDARVRFYRALYDAQHNPLLVQLIEELRGQLGRYLLGMRLDSHHTHHRHVELIEYVAHGDVSGAESWLLAHLEGVRNGIFALEASGPSGTDNDWTIHHPRAVPVRN